MGLAMLIVTFGGVVVAAIAAAAAIVQARSANASKIAAEDARNESRLARDEAVRLSQEANAAFIRQAEAQERANELAKSALPKKTPGISLFQIDEHRWMATNTGDMIAESAQVIGLSGIIETDDDAPRDLHVGDSLYFHSIRTFGSDTPRIAVEFQYDDEDGERHEIHNEITLP